MEHTRSRTHAGKDTGIGIYTGRQKKPKPATIEHTLTHSHTQLHSFNGSIRMARTKRKRDTQREKYGIEVTSSATKQHNYFKIQLGSHSRIF